jgi:hypothetical protein
MTLAGQIFGREQNQGVNTRSIFLIARPATIVLVVLFFWSSVAFGGEVQYAAGFTPEKSEITLGEPIYLAFNLTNTSNKTILLSVDSMQWEVFGSYRIEVFDSSGAKVPDEYGNGMFASSSVGGMTEIKPGDVYVDRLYLPEFIKFKQPGEYTVVASRWVGFGELPESERLLRSGSFSSRDRLNWVDDYLPSTPEGNFITGNRFLSTSSNSQITNRFKLTVLPADKERLLKRAQEMLAKLDGIGSRDMVAKTNGPRALNKMDWETEKSAWLVGKDNLDLAWAVVVLSDIGDQRIIPELKQHLNDNSMKVRFACVKVLCALGEPLRAEWIVPIIKSRQWSLNDPPDRFVADHGGADASGILIECLDMTDSSVTNVWNYRLTNQLKQPGIPVFNYRYIFDPRYWGRIGVPQAIEENAKILNQLQDWLKSHPVSN